MPGSAFRPETTVAACELAWLRVLTFDPAASTVAVYTYSVTQDRFESDPDSRFTLPWAAAGAPFTAIGGTGAPSGAIASARWSDLETGASYEWFAISSDGTLATPGSMRRFSTPEAPASM